MIKKFSAIIFCIAFLIMQNCSANEILATTANDEDPWSLSIVKTDKGDYGFLILNYETEQAGLVPYNKNFYNFYLKESPLIFLMAVKDSPRDVDVELGEWKDDLHLMPVYALFNYSDGKVTMDGYPSSCSGLSASHYQGRILSPYHVKLTEVFLTHMPKLHKVVERGKISLP